MNALQIPQARARFCAGLLLAGAACLLAANRARAQPPEGPNNRLVVATREVPPFAMKNDQGDWTGISIDLLSELTTELQADTEQPLEVEFRELPLTEMLAAVEQGDVDLAAGAITVNFDREKRMDFSHPFFHSGLGIAVAVDGQTQGWLGLVGAVISPTFLKIVAALLGALLLSAVAVYYFERKANGSHFGGGPMRGIGSGLWWAAVTLTTVGYGDKVPTTVPGRLIGLVWMFAGLFIIASFTASVTSALTVTKLKADISGPADLPRVRVGTIAGSTAAGYLRARHLTANEYQTASEALAAILADEADAVVYDAPVLKHAVYQEFAGKLLVLPNTFEEQDYAFPLPPGSPLRERFNLVVLRTTNSDEWRQVLDTYFGDQVAE